MENICIWLKYYTSHNAVLSSVAAQQSWLVKKTKPCRTGKVSKRKDNSVCLFMTNIKDVCLNENNAVISENQNCHFTHVWISFPSIIICSSVCICVSITRGDKGFRIRFPVTAATDIDMMSQPAWRHTSKTDNTTNNNTQPAVWEVGDMMSPPQNMGSSEQSSNSRAVVTVKL